MLGNERRIVNNIDNLHASEQECMPEAMETVQVSREIWKTKLKTGYRYFMSNVIHTPCLYLLVVQVFTPRGRFHLGDHAASVMKQETIQRQYNPNKRWLPVVSIQQHGCILGQSRANTFGHVRPQLLYPFRISSTYQHNVLST